MDRTKTKQTDNLHLPILPPLNGDNELRKQNSQEGDQAHPKIKSMIPESALLHILKRKKKMRKRKRKSQNNTNKKKMRKKRESSRGYERH